MRERPTENLDQTLHKCPPEPLQRSKALGVLRPSLGLKANLRESEKKKSDSKPADCPDGFRDLNIEIFLDSQNQTMITCVAKTERNALHAAVIDEKGSAAEAEAF